MVIKGHPADEVMDNTIKVIKHKKTKVTVYNENYYLLVNDELKQCFLLRKDSYFSLKKEIYNEKTSN